jgi:phage tail-like protein
VEKKLARTNPYRNFRFRLEIDGIEQAGFNECSFGDATTELVEYQVGTYLPTNIKLSGERKYGNITLKWGITEPMVLYNWYKKIVDSSAVITRKNISITLVDEAENEKSRWNIVKAWINKYDPTDTNVKGNDVAIDTLEILHEGFKRVS